jgi:hypothetical protein
MISRPEIETGIISYPAELRGKLGIWQVTKSVSGPVAVSGFGPRIRRLRWEAPQRCQ